jgi:hypothetical protein
MGLCVWGRFGFKGSLSIMLAFFVCGTAFAAEPVPIGATKTAVLAAPEGSKKASAFSRDMEFELSLTGGLRKDKLDWSIAGSSAGTNPNVLSELEWSSVDSYQVTHDIRIRFQRHFYCRGALDYAWVQDGTVRDSDYDGDNRTLEWSRSISESTGDEMWDLSGGVGYAFILSHNRLLVAPLVGYTISKQNLRIKNGSQVVSAGSPAPPVGPLSSQLNSTYSARWMGPWVGCDVLYRKVRRHPSDLAMQFGLSTELHYADYYGEGNWNLRSDLSHPKSFEHDAEGFGICITGKWLIALTAHWNLNLAAGYQYWDTGTGTDRKFLVDGGTAVTLLNGVTWSSSSFMVGASYLF